MAEPTLWTFDNITRFLLLFGYIVVGLIMAKGISVFKTLNKRLQKTIDTQEKELEFLRELSKEVE